MTRNKYLIIVLAAVIAGAGLFLFIKNDKQTSEVNEEVVTRRGTIKIVITSTGTVLPQNRLEIMPQVNGRVDKILVNEGQTVRAGEIIAWMSSNERAALIDSARVSGDQSVQYWNDAYKPIPIVAPITGMVIVRSVEPGQTVTTAGAILVLSDRLIVKADVDETDIGRVRVGQKTIISLDAYPEIKVSAKVSHISYESKIINNVTMYEVDVLPDSVPGVFRSGMSANVDIIESIKNNVLLLPLKAVYDDKGGAKYVLIKNKGRENNLEKYPVTTGMISDNDIEITGGIGEGDIVIIKTVKFDIPDPDSKGTNPFRPQFKKKK